ncbi:MAG: hypothetical protein KGV51_04070 [Moraxellaceae bacterium]|nr:hypothetical protein [Moraxellaceae bacterium]
MHNITSSDIELVNKIENINQESASVEIDFNDGIEKLIIEVKETLSEFITTKDDNFKNNTGLGVIANESIHFVEDEDNDNIEIDLLTDDNNIIEFTEDKTIDIEEDNIEIDLLTEADNIIEISEDKTVDIEEDNIEIDLLDSDDVAITVINEDADTVEIEL